MGRAVILAIGLASAALAVAGCGAAATVEPAALSAGEAPAGPVAVELTDGRLGSATTVRVGSRPRELTPGGRLDVRPEHGSARRDGVGAGAACANATVAPSAAALPAVADATLCLLNGERADRGLPPLAPNPKLTGAATAYAQDLVDGSYFSHTGRDGSDVRQRIERVGYLPRDAGWLLGENLAWGTGALATPGAIMQAWMNSPGHRDNILNPEYREIGIGVVTGNPSRADGAGATYATTFGAIQGARAQRPAAAPKARQASRRGKRARKARAARQRRVTGKAARERGVSGRTAKAKDDARGDRPRRAGRRAVSRSRGPVAHIAI